MKLLPHPARWQGWQRLIISSTVVVAWLWRQSIDWWPSPSTWGAWGAWTVVECLASVCIGSQAMRFFFFGAVWPFRRSERSFFGRDRQTETSDHDPLAITSAGSFPAFISEDPEQTESSVEHIDEDMPILAHRAALLVPGIGGPRFKSMTNSGGGGRIFARDEVAVCRVSEIFYLDQSGQMRCRARHVTPAPNLHCTCGFYAVPIGMSLPYPDDPHIDLLVELSGTIIEHEYGYRAQHQRVVEARIPGCELCGSATHSLRYDPWSTRCGAHIPTGDSGVDGDDPVEWVEVASLSAALGVPVTALAPL